jgi:hypothetical protein
VEIGVERTLAGFRDRVQAMLDLQTAVHDGTVVLNELSQRAADKKLRPEGRQVVRKLSADEKQLVVEATRAIGLLESEGTAAAFLEVFRELRNDMRRVQRRLELGDVGGDTQALEKDIIDTLKEMVGALSRKRAGQGLWSVSYPPTPYIRLNFSSSFCISAEASLSSSVR